MDVRAHTVIWDRIHHGDHECASQLFELALVVCEPRANVRDSVFRRCNRYM